MHKIKNDAFTWHASAASRWEMSSNKLWRLWCFRGNTSSFLQCNIGQYAEWRTRLAQTDTQPSLSRQKAVSSTHPFTNVKSSCVFPLKNASRLYWHQQILAPLSSIWVFAKVLTIFHFGIFSATVYVPRCESSHLFVAEDQHQESFLMSICSSSTQSNI